MATTVYTDEQRATLFLATLAQIEERWIANAKGDPRLKDLTAAVTHYLLGAFSKLPVKPATADKPAFDPLQILMEWNGKGTKFADAVSQLQEVFPDLEADDLTDMPPELAKLAGVSISDAQAEAMAAYRSASKEKKQKQSAEASAFDAGQKKASMWRTAQIVGFSLLAVVLLLAGLYFGPTLLNLLPGDSPVSSGLTGNSASPLNRPPVERTADGLPVVYQLQPAPSYIGNQGFGSIDMESADCGELKQSNLYVVTKVVGRDYNEQQVYAYWDQGTGDVCFAPQAYFDWVVAGQTVAPVAGVVDENVKPLIDKLNSLTYKLGAGGLMSKDQPLGKLEMFLIGVVLLVALGELFTRHWVAGLSGFFIFIALIVRVLIDNKSATSPLMIWAPMVINFVLTLGVGSIVNLLSEAKFNLKAFTQMPVPDRDRYLAILANPFLHSTEWSWGNNIMAVYVVNYLFGPTSKTLVGLLGLPIAALVTVVPILFFDFQETRRRHATFKHYDSEKMLKYADWITYGLGWVAVIVILLLALFLAPGVNQTLWVTLSLVLPFAFIAGFLNGGQGRGLERGYDFVRTAALTSGALLPLALSILSAFTGS
ncbi:hypothetical protein HYV31_02735 [candidate division WWE3 bacterium]|nr:hypothetical protein [candidate division WWE3 bacterium]